MKTLEGTLSGLDVIFGRRSMRSYAPDTIPVSTVRGLLDAAVQAPPALFRQRLAFVVVQDPRTLHRLSDLAKSLWRQEVRTNRHRYLDVSRDILNQFSDPEFDLFRGATTLVVICRQEEDAFGDADCWLAAENFMLAASALGLASDPVGAAASALNTAEMRLALGIPPVTSAVAPVVLGVPATAGDAEERKEPDVIAWR
jgi:nitroreductase